MKLLMRFLEVALLLSRASCFITYLKDLDRGEHLRTTKCPKTVFWGKQGHVTCKMLSLQKSLFLSVEF